MDGAHASTTNRILGAAIEVHRQLGPGLLESVYKECLRDELLAAGLTVEAEVDLPVVYKGRTLGASFRADIIVDRAVLLELKAVESLLPVHDAQTLSYLRLSGLRVALLLNFHCPRLKDGIRRFVL